MKISLRQKKLKSGKISLFLEYYNGYHIDNTGKKIFDRTFDYLKIYLHQNPKTQKEKKENKENLSIAEKILAIKQSEYYQGKYGIEDSFKGKMSFLKYFEQLKEERYESKGNYDNWDAVSKHLKKYCSTNILLNNINEEFVLGFKKYLDINARTKGNVSLAQNSKYTYFNKFRACLRKAYEDGYLSKNVLRNIKGFEQSESTREYLTFEEIQSIANTECKYEVLKKAFLFSCLTGLRWSDVNKLTWGEVHDEETGVKIIFRQLKTKAIEYLYISKQAREFLGDRKSDNSRVFVGLTYSFRNNVELLRWVMRAGITKHITFHSARHTHAVLMLENGADIYTVSKLLGHKDIRTTEIYAKIVDKKKKDASELIPTIKLKI